MRTNRVHDSRVVHLSSKLCDNRKDALRDANPPTAALQRPDSPPNDAFTTTVVNEC